MKFIVSTEMKITQGWWNSKDKKAFIPRNVQERLIQCGEDQILEIEKITGTKSGSLSRIIIAGIEYQGWWEIAIVEKKE